MDRAAAVDNDGSPQRALALAAFFTVVAIAQLQALQNAFTTPLQEAITAFQTSPWALAILADYVIGAIFASLYLSLRPALLAALLTPILGSFVVLLYMAVSLAHHRDIVTTILPRSASVEVCTPSKHSRTAFWGFASLLIAFGSICTWAWVNESLKDGYNIIMTVPWIEMTFLDNLGGLVFTATFVIVREGGLSFVVAGWWLALFFLGNAATCVYVMFVAKDALAYDIAFEEMLLSNRDSITYDPVF